MKDLFGNELAIGDVVGFNPPRYKGLVLATVVGFTPKMVKLSYKDNSFAWTKTLSETVVGSRDTIKRQ